VSLAPRSGSQLLLIVVIAIIFFAILRLKRFLIDINPQEGLGPG
jgi:flagellar biogenesis protein FliO